MSFIYNLEHISIRKVNVNPKYFNFISTITLQQDKNMSIKIFEQILRIFFLAV